MAKFSIYSGVCLKKPIEERIAAIAEAGFDAVCLDFEKELAATETSWENQMRLAQKYGLPVENVHLSGKGMNAVWADGEAGEAVIARLIEELRDMSSLGIKIGVAHVTWGHGLPEGTLECGLARYKKAVDAAEKFGVVLALENSVYAQHVHYLLNNISSPYLGFCYDSGHENAFTPTEDYLSHYGDILVAMHLHDNDGVNDSHWLPLHKNGTVNWSEKVSKLKKTKLFGDIITLESGVDGEDLLKEFKESLAVAKKLADI
jgi:sugar phosphate isomerase/epimerase